MGSLQGREKDIAERRLLAEEPITLREIGMRYGVSRERARQLEANLKEKMKAFLKAELGDLGRPARRRLTRQRQRHDRLKQRGSYAAQTSLARSGGGPGDSLGSPARRETRRSPSVDGAVACREPLPLRLR